MHASAIRIALIAPILKVTFGLRRRPTRRLTTGEKNLCRQAVSRKQAAGAAAITVKPVAISNSLFNLPPDQDCLSTCSAAAELISARGRKDRQLKQQLAEQGVPKQFWTKRRCQEQPMHRPAAPAANACSKKPKVTADAAPSFSAMP